MKKIILFLPLIIIAVFSNSMTLEDVLSRYKDTSLEQRKISIERSVANKALLQSLPAILPTVNYSASMDSSSSSRYTYTQGLSLNQTIFNVPDFISIFNNKENMDMANLNYSLSNYNLIVSIINDYFMILQYRMKIELDTALIRREEINVKKSETLLKSGLVSETDYYNIKSNYYNIQYSYRSDQNTYDKIKTDFELITGIKEADLLQDIDTIPSFSYEFDPEKLLDRVPEVLLAKKTYYVAKNNEASAYAEFLPTASFSASAGLTDTLFDINDFGNNYSLGTSLRVSFPLFTGFSRGINTLLKAGARKTSQIDYIKTRQQAANELGNLHKTINQTVDLYKAAEMTYLSMKSMFDKSTRLYDAGEISTPDYITSQKNYIESSVNLMNAKAEVYKLYYRYLYLLRRI